MTDQASKKKNLDQKLDLKKRKFDTAQRAQSLFLKIEFS